MTAYETAVARGNAKIPHPHHRLTDTGSPADESYLRAIHDGSVPVGDNLTRSHIRHTQDHTPHQDRELQLKYESDHFCSRTRTIKGSQRTFSMIRSCCSTSTGILIRVKALSDSRHGHHPVVARPVRLPGHQQGVHHAGEGRRDHAPREYLLVGVDWSFLGTSTPVSAMNPSSPLPRCVYLVVARRRPRGHHNSVRCPRYEPRPDCGVPDGAKPLHL